jgi:hypothetical protein
MRELSFVSTIEITARAHPGEGGQAMALQQRHNGDLMQGSKVQL